MGCWSPLALALLAGPVHAGPWRSGELVPLSLPAPVRDVAVGSWGGASLVFVATDAGVVLLDPATLEAVGSTDEAASAVILRDLDGDGAVELVTCGPRGIALVRGTPEAPGDPVRLSKLPCERLADWDADADYASLVVAAGGAVQVLKPGAGGLKPTALDVPESDAHLIASRGAVLAVAPAGGAVRLSITSDGTEEVPADGPIAGLVASDHGFSWVVGGAAPALYFGVAEGVPVAADPVGLALADVDGDLALDAVVVHGGAEPALGVLADAAGPEDVLGLPWSPSALAVADLDGDGCAEVVVGAEDVDRAVVLRGACASAPEVGWGSIVASAAEASGEPLPEPRAATLALGTEWASLQAVVGTPVERTLVDAEGRSSSFEVKGGPPGLSVGPDGALSYVPAPSDVAAWRVAVRVFGDDHERWTGIDLWVHATEGGTAPGAPAVREGPVGTEAVAADEDPAADGAADPGRSALSQGRDPSTGFWAFQQCVLGAGAAGGAYRVGSGSVWESIGGPDVAGAGSPAATFACSGGGSGVVNWFLGADSAPTFVFENPDGFELNHLFAASLGIHARWDRGSLGVHGTGGLLLAGVGARATWLPLRTSRGYLHGIEGRLTAFPPTLGFQAMLLYAVQLPLGPE